MDERKLRDFPSNKALGRTGENIAASVMRAKGYAVLDQNWRYGHLEIDLVCEKENLLVFVEVKARSGALYGGASHAVTETKKRNLAHAAQAWLQQHDLWDSPCRFDVICITRAGEDFSLEHYANAFEPGAALDSGDPAW